MKKINPHLIPWLCVVLLAAAYAWLFFRVSRCRYNNFLYSDWDLAIYNQFFRGLLRGHPYSSLLDVPFIGNHVELTMTLALPLYALFPTPVTLLAIQSIMLGLGAIPLFLIARHALNVRWGLIFAGMYLIYPAVGYANLNEFHPETFLPFIQFFLFYFLIKNDFKKFFLFLLLCLFAKENMALLLIMTGLYAGVTGKEKKWVVTPIALGALWFLLYLKVFSPHFTQGKIGVFSLYGHLGDTLPRIVSAIVLHPIETLKLMALPHKLRYLLVLFGPLSFLSLFSPLILAIALPNFLQHLLSSRITETVIFYYYPAEAAAVIFIAAIFGLKFLIRLQGERGAYYLLVPAVALLFSFRFGPQPYLWQRMSGECQRTDTVLLKDRLIKMIPPEAPVVASLRFLPKLSSLTGRLYSFHRAISGTYLLSESKFVLPADVEYALIDFDDMAAFSEYAWAGKKGENVLRFFSDNKWQPVKAADNTVFFKRNYKGDFSLFEAAVPDSGKNKANVIFDDTLELLSYSVKDASVAGGETIDLTFFWEVRRKTGRDYWLYIAFFDPAGKNSYQAVHPLCYKIYPTQLWQTNEIVREEYRVSVPRSLQKGFYRLCAGILDDSGRRFCRISPGAGTPKNKWLADLSDIRVE
jgi:uncharacterized membrane protein